MNFNYLIILIKKELLQISRDKSILAITFILPLLLVFIYGSTLRMDIKPVNIAYVSSMQNELNYELYSAFYGSDYFKTVYLESPQQAKDLMAQHKIKAYVYLQNNFGLEFQKKRAQIDVIINGTEAQAAAISLSYIESTLMQVLGRYASGQYVITVNGRNWFNEANDSQWFLMSGQYIAIVTVMCVFLSSFIISREWDRLTIETLQASNASALEIVLSKIFVYFVLGLMGMIVTILFGQLCYGIPIRGSYLMLFINMSVYTLEMICLGVLISSVCKNQFLSVEYAIIAGFLPAVMLSGLIFDLRGVHDFIRYISVVLPPTYAVQSNRIIFLSGGSLDILWRNILIHFTFITIFIFLSVNIVRRDIK